MLTILTGARGSGKTSLLLALLEQAPRCNIALAGVICPAVFADGSKTGFDALLLPQGVRLPLGRRFANDGIVHEYLWNMSAEAFAAVNAHLDTGKAGATIAPHEHNAAKQQTLLIVDELGPVELLEGKGFTSALALLDAKSYEDAVIVVRESLVQVASERWQVDQVIAATGFKGTLLSKLVTTKEAL